MVYLESVQMMQKLVELWTVKKDTAQFSYIYEQRMGFNLG